MYNIKLAGLDTGKVYYVKVRAKVNGYETSEWTMPFRFETPMDTMPPGRIENLSWLSEGSSFIATWEAPQFNEDGSPCGDVSHYNLVFKDLDRDITRQQRTVDTSFALDFNRNVKMFGAAAGRIELTVTAVDLSDNESKTVVAIAQNPPPAKVQNVTASVGVESIGLKWDANIENDLAFYEVHVGTAAGFTPSPSTLRAKVASGSDVFTYDTSSLVTLYFKIIAVDTFNQKSVPSDVVSAQPRLTTDYDKEPPGTVSGFTVTQVLASDNTSATARISFTSNPEEDLDKYEVQHRKTGDTTAPWSFTNVPSDQTTAEIKPLPLSTSYDFRIRAVDFNANKGVWSSVVVAPGVKKTTLPAAPTGIVVTGGLTNLMVRWNASTDPSMANWGGTYEVQVSKASSFTSPITIKTASTLASFINLDANTVYYVRIRSIDPYLNTGAWSTTSNGNTGTVADPNASKITWSDTQPTGGKTNDLWIKTPENVQYRYNGTTWVKAQDSELATGIANAVASADGKNTIYYSTPPASGIKAGDTWFDGATIKVYQNGSWVDVSTALDNAQAAQAIQIAGSKNKTYYVSRATATGMIEGDTLFDTTEGNKQYRYNGTAWVSVQDAAIAAADQAAGQAQQTADNKNTIYYATPPAGAVLKDGDVWFDGAKIKTYRGTAWVDSSTNLTTQQAETATTIATGKNKTYYTTYAARPTTGLTTGDLLFDTADKYKAYRYNGSAWESVRDGTIKDAQDAANAAKTAAELRAQTFYEATGPANTNSRLKTNDLWIRSTDNQLHRWTGTAWVEIQDDAIALTQSNLTTAVGNLQTDISNVNDKADGKVDSFIQNTAPTAVTEGDIWFDTSVTPIAVKVRRGTTWEVSGDKAALDAAAAVQINLNATNTALNKKNTTYAQTSAPTTGLVIGDIWLDTTLIAGTPKNEMNRWDGAKWVKTQDKTIFDVQALADGKAMVFTKATMPTDAESDLGDIWFDTSTTPWGVKVRTGAAAWTVSGDKTARDAAITAQTEAARKIQSFYTDTDPATIPANNVKAGDLWYKTTDKRARVRASNNTWVELKDTAIDAAQTAANNAQTAANTAITNAQTAFNLADGKAQVFWGGARPANLVAADAGDIWVDTAKTPNEIQVWSGTSWSVTGDPATKAIAEAANSLAGQKAYTYIQNTAPTAATVPAPAKGDIWIKNNVTPNEVSVYTGSTWVAAGDKTARDSAGAKAHVFTTTNDTAPSSPAPKRGDVWINTATGKTKVHSGTTWVDSTDPEARNIANSKITTYYNATAPTAPAGGFTTGDLWVRTTDNRLHRWAGSWTELKDADIAAAKAAADAAQSTASTAITNAQSAFNLADGKANVFWQNTEPTGLVAADKGDIWVNTAKTPNEVNVWSGSAWTVTGDPATKAIADAAQTLAAQKSYVYTQTTAPTTSSTPAPTRGDTWIHSTTGETKIWSGTAWINSTDPGAREIANRKITTYYNATAPTAPTGGFTTGDLWVRTTDNRMHRWAGSWTELKDAAITAVESTANNLANTIIPNLATQVDNKVEVTVGGTRPSYASATAAQRAAAKGDMHIDTTTGLVTVYSGVANTWNDVKDPAAAQAATDAATLAGKKVQVFGGTVMPANNAANALKAHDLWIRDSDKKMHRWTGTVWEIAQDYKIDGAALKGNNLVFNGHGELGDATNWTGDLTYTSSDAPPGSKGSFIVSGKRTISLQETIPVNPYSNYTMSVWARRLSPAEDRVYLYLQPIDAYGSTISPVHYMYRPGSTTQLTADLKPGDTEIKVGSTANWYVGTSTNYYVTFWDYVDPGGKAWPKETYTKNFAVRPYDASAGPLPETSIPLTSPWTGALKPAGTWISSGLSGGTYMYNAMSYTLPGEEWTFYKSNIIGGIHDDPSTSAGRKFPLPTAFVKIGFLANYNNEPGAVQAFSGLDFSDVNAAQDMATSAMDSANARNRSVYSAANPTGTTLNGYAFITGDTWFKQDASNTIIGMWEFRNGVWIAKTLNNQVIANLDAGKINAGTINADRIGAGSISASKLQVSDTTNVIPNNGWEPPVTDWNTTDVSFSIENNVRYVRFNTPSVVNTLISPAFALQSGEYMIEFEMRKISGTTGAALMSVLVETTTLTGARIAVIPASTSPAKSTGTIWEKFTGTIIIPENVQRGRVWLETGAVGNHGMDVRLVSLRKKVGTTLIENGAITTDKIKANAVTATQIAGETITASEIAAGAITAHKIKAGEIDATKIVSGGMDGSVVIANGTITATQIAGQTITGDKIKANTIDAGHIQAGSITIGANAPIAPGTVATPSDVTGAISTASTDATNKANQARIDAIAAAATDAQTKADAAKLAAENAAKAYADGEISEATAQALIDAAADAQTKADAAKLAAENAAKGYTDTTVAPINTKLGQWTKTGTTFIDGGQIFTDSITAGQIAAGAITTSELATDSVTAAKIKSGEITTAKIVVGGLDGTTAIANGTITTDKLNARAVTAEKIAVGAITIGGANGHIPDGAVALPADVTAAINTAAADATAKANQAKLDAEAAAEAYANGEISAAALVAAQDAQTKANAARDAAVLAASTDATNKANQARIDAINAAAQDAQTKADAAKLAAEQAAKAYADGEISEATAQALIEAAADAQTKANAAKTAAENAANAYTNTTVAPINTTLGNWRYQDTTFINGGSIYTNTITANQIAANTITADEIAANAITTSELAANSVTAGKILAGEITGEKLATNTAIINNLQIQSALTINHTNGHIKSSNWNDANKTGFYMDQQQLIVHNGRIEAAAIRLQDSANIIQPQFASFFSKIDAYTGLLSSGISSVVKHPGEGRFGGDALGITTNANGYLMMGKTGVPNIPIEGGQQYIISFYISNRASKVFTLQAGLYGTAAINVYATAVSIANTTAWTRYSFVVTAPANMIQAIVRFNPQNAPVTFRIDGLQVEKKVSASDLPSSWSPPGYTSIDGESITTGAISSSATAASNPSIAAWSINTQGAARFADATIDGKLVVGSSGLDNGNISIQSDQYSAGNAGWSIKGNGDVEFNNGTFRGKLSLERAGNEEVPLRMTASVSPVKSYSTETIFSEIDTANISGVTYAYTRNDNETPGVYLPNLPDLNKRGNFFIGPTTERALNIQVHDGAEEDSIFLSNPPKNVTLTSLNIGEQTETANPPALREDQGLVFRTYRNESRDYTIGGFSTAAESNIVSNMYAVVAREKSPLIPEGYDGASEYPETKHEWMSSGVYEAPKNKNILPETAAKGKFFLRTTQNSIVSSNVQADFASQSGLGLYAHNVFRSSTGTFGFSFTVTIPTAGPHILSFYVNNTFATLPLFVGANLGGLAMIPNDPMDPTQSTPDTITKSNFTMVPAGTKSRRVSFYVSNTTAGSKSLQFVFSLGSNSSIRIAKLQLERPAYKTDASLPSDITSLHYPTPWTVNGSKVSTSTSFVLRSEPFVDPVDNALGTKMWGQVYPVVDRGIKSRSPAEAVLSFRTQYDSPVSEDRTSASAEYRFAANGLTFPGRHVPYLPVGLTIDYNFMAMAQAARPVTGGSSNHSLQINDRTEWPIKLGNGRAIADNFETAVPVTETDFYVPGWGTVNQNGKSRVASNKIASYSADSYTPQNDGDYYIYRVDSMDNADQSVSVSMSRYSANFGAFLAPAWGGPVINIDPSTGARIAVSYNVLEGHYKIYRFHSNGARSELVNGSLSLNNNSTPFTLTLSRQGNTLTFLANGSVVRTYTDSSLPTDGRHVGLNIRRGYFEEFRASDSAELSNTFGVLQPYSINVNTDRGIEVDSKSLIVVNAPGYYNVSCHLSPDGNFGGSASDHYQIYLQTEGDGQISTYQMSPDISQYQGGILRLQGSMVAYLSGNTRFYLWTNDTSTTRVASAQIQVVRMA